jgi:hypothetical protein
MKSFCDPRECPSAAVRRGKDDAHVAGAPRRELTRICRRIFHLERVRFGDWNGAEHSTARRTVEFLSVLLFLLRVSGERKECCRARDPNPPQP